MQFHKPAKNAIPGLGRGAIITAQDSFLDRFNAEAGDVLTSIFTHSCDCIKLLTLDGELEYVSDSARDALGLANASDAIGRDWPAMWPPEQQPALRAALARAAQGDSTRFDGTTGGEGGKRYWDIALSPVRGAGGATTHLLAVSTETTAHVEAARLERERRAQAEREIGFAATVAHELRHRLKNQLAVVNAVTKLLSRHTGSARELARKLEEKLISLAAAHDLLAISHEQALTIGQAVSEVLKASGAGERVEVTHMPEGELPDESVQQLALLLGELQTNALKHGALRTDDGSVRLSGTTDSGVLTLRWEEDCGTPIERVDAGAGGFQLIRRLGSAAGRQPSIDWQPTGIAVQFHVRVGS